MADLIMQGTISEGKIHIDRNSFDRLREIIYERAGIALGDNKQYLLENRLANRLKEYHCGNFAEYCDLIQYHAEGPREIVRMIDCVTTNETCFFREKPHLLALRDIVLPEMVERKRKRGERNLRIWSAACSTGEEPYTIAIVLQEMRTVLSGFNVEILASDINESVIQSARRGVYGENTLRNVEPHLQKKYFVPEGHCMRVSDTLKNMVRFFNLNLNEPRRLKMMRNIDVVFCKNVMIYFDTVVKKRVVESLYDSLNPGGILFVSPSESLHDCSRSFKPVHVKFGIVYRKET